MKLMNWFRGFLKKKQLIILTFCKGCKQDININLYSKTLRRYIIGSVYKNGKTLTLYCDGKERK